MSVARELAAVTGALDRSEQRQGQAQMADAVEKAIEHQRHLVVQAGTGTGKTLGYLVPALLSGKSVMVATATKALQDQLASKDLPFLQEQLGRLGREFDWAVLKGRSNYICLQRLREVNGGAGQEALELDDMPVQLKAEVKRLAEWAGTTDTGDQAELEWSPSDKAWQAVSVGSDECPGATRCPLGGPCFAERARERAMAADVVVVNTHLYGLNVASGGVILPEHDVVVVDEAHMLEDIMSDTVGVSISGGRFLTFAHTMRKVVDDQDIQATLLDLVGALRDALSPSLGERLPFPITDPVGSVLLRARKAVDDCLAALRKIDTDNEDAKQKRLRAQQLATRLAESLDQAIGGREGYVAFVSGGPDFPRLEIAPLDVGPVLAAGLWEHKTAILTSATIPSSLPQRVGLPEGGHDVLDVGSPFDYEHNAILYCAVHMPDPRSPDYGPKSHEEMVALIQAAGGRTLALFTSYKAMDAAAEAVRAKVPYRVLTQRDMPKTALVNAFSAEESSCLFATSGFFQGVDIPGATLSLVIIDRIPFPRPDDPLLSARRDLLGKDAFGQIDLPRASTLLAQATGRLVRTATDRGVVAVLDPRLGKAGYRWEIVNALPPMKRTRHRAEVEAFLRELTTETE